MTARVRRWLLHELRTDVEPRTPAGVMVTLAASIGSDLDEQSRATGIPVEELRAAVLECYDLPSWSTDILGAWLVCAVWRHGFRCGCDEAETGSIETIAAMAARCDPSEGWRGDFEAYKAGKRYERAISEDGKRRRRLTIEEAAQISDLYDMGSTMAEIAQRFAVNVSTVHRCLRAKTRAGRAAHGK